MRAGHCSVRLRLPFQVWTQVACRSQGPQVHVGAQAGQVRGLRTSGSCSSLLRQVARCPLRLIVSSLQVRQCHAPGPVVSGPFRGESAGLDPGCVPVSVIDECEGPFCQRKAGTVLQSGQVEAPGAHRSMQRQAQVALSGSHPVCVPQPRTSGACRCPGRSGESAEGKLQLQQSFVSGCIVPAVVNQHSSQVCQCHAPVPVVSGPLLGEPAGLDPGYVAVSGAACKCQGSFCQFQAGKVHMPGQVEV